MNFWNNFGELIWWFLWIFAFTAYLFALFLTALIYLIARGNGMAQRSQRDARQYQAATDDYIRGVAGASPADEIAKAKGLLDSGTITQGEYDLLKAKALAHPTQNV